MPQDLPSRLMDLNELLIGYQFHPLQRSHPARGHLGSSSHLSQALAYGFDIEASAALFWLIDRFAPANLVSRDGFGSPVPRQPAHLIFRLNLVLTYGIPPEFRSGVQLYNRIPPYAIGSVPSLSRHAFAYRWRSLPRVRRHRASKPQGSSERVLPWQVTIDQLIRASLSHTHYWHILKND